MRASRDLSSFAVTGGRRSEPTPTTLEPLAIVSASLVSRLARLECPLVSKASQNLPTAANKSPQTVSICKIIEKRGKLYNKSILG